MKKLTFITNPLNNYGGGEVWVLEVCKELYKIYDITILDPHTNKKDYRVSDNYINYILKKRKINRLIFSNYGIKSNIEGYPFTLLIPKIGSFYLILKTIKNSDVIYCLSSNPFILTTTIFLSRIFRKKMIYGIHNTYFTTLFSIDNKIPFLRKLIKNYSIIFLKSVKYFHAVSETHVNIIKKHFNKAHIYHVPNFIADKEESKTYFNNKRFVVLFVGRLSVYEKGLDFLVDIITKTLDINKNVYFRIAGSGLDGETLLKPLEIKYKNNVKLCGFLNKKQILKEYKNSNLLIFTSRDEIFPLVLLEAQNYGLPVIAFNVNGPKEIIKNSLQGALIKNFNIEEFSNLILSYYKKWLNNKEYYINKKTIKYTINKYYNKKNIINLIINFLKL